MKISIQSVAESSGIQFGTSGLRGLVTQMTYPVCYAYTKAFLRSVPMSGTGKVAVGIDLRPSSPAIAIACVDAIIDEGLEPVFCGQLPTPALAFFALQQGIPAVMVTGSHIPFDRNGIKFYRADGEISKQDEAQINSAWVLPVKEDKQTVLPDTCPDALVLYKQRYLNLFAQNALTGLKVGVYQHSSVARDLLPELLLALGAEVVALERTHHFVPIDTEAVSEADTKKAQNWVAEYHLDAIVTTDGDADRPLLADETGAWMRGDIVGLLTAHFLGARSIVTPVSCNTAIEQCAYFRNVVRTRIGSPYVIAEMEALPASLLPVAGFEANGGFMAGSGLNIAGQELAALPTRDAILPILCLLVMARGSGKALSELSQNLPARFTFSDRLQEIPVSATQRILRELTESPTEFRLAGIDLGSLASKSEVDGVRLIYSEGDIVHFRGSGNAPELRCYAESASPARSQLLVSAGLAWVRERLD